jgi:hypothetical protein
MAADRALIGGDEGGGKLRLFALEGRWGASAHLRKRVCPKPDPDVRPRDENEKTVPHKIPDE